MDREFELLKKQKAENDEDFSALPKKLETDEILDGMTKVIETYTFLYDGRELDIDEEVKIIVDNIYTILDLLVKMGVHPGFIFNTLLKYKQDQLEHKDDVLYNWKRKAADTVYFPYNDVREELNLMNNYNYQGNNEGLALCSDKILTMNKKFKLPYSVTPIKIDKERKQEIYFRLINQRDSVINSDDIIDESISLIDMLYTSINLLVEMGIDDDKLLINRINMEEEKGKLH